MRSAKARAFDGSGFDIHATQAIDPAPGQLCHVIEPLALIKSETHHVVDLLDPLDVGAEPNVAFQVQCRVHAESTRLWDRIHESSSRHHR